MLKRFVFQMKQHRLKQKMATLELSNVGEGKNSQKVKDEDEIALWQHPAFIMLIIYIIVAVVMLFSYSKLLHSFSNDSGA